MPHYRTEHNDISGTFSFRSSYSGEVDQPARRGENAGVQFDISGRRGPDGALELTGFTYRTGGRTVDVLALHRQGLIPRETYDQMLQAAGWAEEIAREEDRGVSHRNLSLAALYDTPMESAMRRIVHASEQASPSPSVPVDTRDAGDRLRDMLQAEGGAFANGRVRLSNIQDESEREVFAQFDGSRWVGRGVVSLEEAVRAIERMEDINLGTLSEMDGDGDGAISRPELVHFATQRNRGDEGHGVS